MSFVTIISLLIPTLCFYSNEAAPLAAISVSAPFAVGSRSLLRSIDDKSEKPDYVVDLNATNFDSVLSETPATYAIVEFFAHWFVCHPIPYSLRFSQNGVAGFWQFKILLLIELESLN